MTGAEFSRLRTTLLGLSQSQLARVLDCNVRTIKRYEQDGCSGTTAQFMRALSLRRFPYITGRRIGTFPPSGLTPI
jgi:transcriptional regulator with XRE-family HTH domain